MRVTAAPGLKVPMEGKPREYIEAAAVDVPDTPYYRRRLRAKELLPAAAETTGTASAKKAAKAAQGDTTGDAQ